MTVLYKTRTGKACPRLLGRLIVQTFELYVSGKADEALSPNMSNFILGMGFSLEPSAGTVETLDLTVSGMTGFSVSVQGHFFMTSAITLVSIVYTTITVFSRWLVQFTSRTSSSIADKLCHMVSTYSPL